MKRRTSTLPCRIFTFGCRPPTENASLVNEQFERAHAYRNKLAEIELAQRHRFRELIRRNERLIPLDEAIELAERRLAELRTQINFVRASARQRVELKPVGAEATLLRRELGELRAERRRVRDELKADARFGEALALLQSETRQKIKSERARSGVHWGTYLLVEAEAERAARESKDPKYRRWDGSGRIGVSLNVGRNATVDDVLSHRNAQLQIDALEAKTWETRAGRRAAKTFVRIRVGSEGRAPIWARFPVILHRPLPADGVIKQAWISRTREGTVVRFALQLVIEANSLARPLEPGAPRAALNLTWRKRPHGLRVAYLVDECGAAEELVVPQRLLDRLDHADSIQGTRGRNLEGFRSELKANLLALSLATERFPEWMLEACNTMHNWRSAARFTSLILRWSRSRIPNDAAIFEHADQWRKQDRHLLQWETRERARALRHRRELYRCFAARLAQRYSSIVVKDVNLRPVARAAKPEEPQAAYATAVRKNRVRAAVSDLRGAVGHRLPLHVVSSDGAMHICHCCGNYDPLAGLTSLEHTCIACCATWDQDFNLARNLLEKGVSHLASNRTYRSCTKMPRFEAPEFSAGSS